MASEEKTAPAVPPVCCYPNADFTALVCSREHGHPDSHKAMLPDGSRVTWATHPRHDALLNPPPREVPPGPVPAEGEPIPTKYDCTCRECKEHNANVDKLLAAQQPAAPTKVPSGPVEIDWSPGDSLEKLIGRAQLAGLGPDAIADAIRARSDVLLGTGQLDADAVSAARYQGAKQMFRDAVVAVASARLADPAGRHVDPYSVGVEAAMSKLVAIQPSALPPPSKPAPDVRAALVECIRAAEVADWDLQTEGLTDAILARFDVRAKP